MCQPALLEGCRGPVEELTGRLRDAARHSGPPSEVPGDVVHFGFGSRRRPARSRGVLEWRECRDGDAGYDPVTVAWDLAAWLKAPAAVGARLAGR